MICGHAQGFFVLLHSTGKSSALQDLHFSVLLACEIRISKVWFSSPYINRKYNNQCRRSQLGSTFFTHDMSVPFTIPFVCNSCLQLRSASVFHENNEFLRLKVSIWGVEVELWREIDKLRLYTTLKPKYCLF